jgi:arsenate reductase
VIADQDRLQQILINLVDNAVKYTPEHGCVTVSAVPVDTVVEVRVIDTGIGIPAAHLPRITERFYRVDRARSRELGGTGLGLAIVKHLVHAHGGALTIESEPERGTTVRFTLPVAPRAAGTTTLFACVHNAGRSQMAAAVFNAMADRDHARALSAGTEPGERVLPNVVEVMREIGIDLSGAKPQKLTAELAAQVSLLVTVGCGDACPYVPGLRVEDWLLEDPKGQTLDRVRAIRDEIRQRVTDLLGREGWIRRLS